MKDPISIPKDTLNDDNISFHESYLSCGVFLISIILVSYGYELFNFNLTIDEENHASLAGRVYWRWVGQGRWGMALLNYFILPNPIVPTVSLFIGLLGTAMGMFLYFKNSMSLDRLGLSSAIGLAITTPTLAFTYTFSTLAYGIGFGFMAISLGLLALRGKSWMGFTCACMLGAFAISIYQTFVFAIGILVSLCALNLWMTRDIQAIKFSLKLVAFLVVSVILYLMLNYMALRWSSLELVYVESYVSLGDFLSNPVERSLRACERFYALVALKADLFGEQSCWLGISILMSSFFSIWIPLSKLQLRQTLLCLGLNLGVILLMIFPDAIATNNAPIRSIIYIPIGVAVLFANAYGMAGRKVKVLLVSCAFLAIIGNSMIINRLNLSSALSESKDRSLAEAVVSTVRILNSRSASPASLFKVEIVGGHSWPETALQRNRETFGASFFEWDGGNRHRVANYLNLNGLNVIGASESERMRVFDEAKKMPAWPSEGWMNLFGDIIVLKFGDYSLNQSESLCAQGILELCRK